MQVLKQALQSAMQLLPQRLPHPVTQTPFAADEGGHLPRSFLTPSSSQGHRAPTAVTAPTTLTVPTTLPPFPLTRFQA